MESVKARLSGPVNKKLRDYEAKIDPDKFIKEQIATEQMAADQAANAVLAAVIQAQQAGKSPQDIARIADTMAQVFSFATAQTAEWIAPSGLVEEAWEAKLGYRGAGHTGPQERAPRKVTVKATPTTLTVKKKKGKKAKAQK